MGVGERIRRLLKANLHEALERAEDPARLLNYLVLEMREGLEQAREETATAMAAERRLAQQAEEADEAAARWTRRARLAVEHGEDDLAREALRRREAALALGEQYRRAHQEQAVAVAELRGSLEQLQARLQEANARRAALLGQIQVGKAQQVIARTMRQTVGEEAFAAFDRVAASISTDRLRTAALTELAQDEVEQAFLVAEENGTIERQLAALKEDARSLEPPVERAALEDQGATESEVA